MTRTPKSNSADHNSLIQWAIQMMKKLSGHLRASIAQVDDIHRQKAIDDLEWEVTEMKHVFALLSAGCFIGMPVVPLPVTLELLPDAQQEFAIMLSKIPTAQSPLSEQFSKFDAV